MSSWREVCALGLFVLGAVAMALLHEKEIALVAMGAAAGYASNNRRDQAPARKDTP